MFFRSLIGLFENHFYFCLVKVFVHFVFRAESCFFEQGEIRPILC